MFTIDENQRSMGKPDLAAVLSVSLLTEPDHLEITSPKRDTTKSAIPETSAGLLENSMANQEGSRVILFNRLYE